jgi:hypothetical protein
MANPYINNYTTEQFLLGGNIFFKDGEYTNSTGSTVALVAGQSMGQVLATGKWLPQIAASTDGSEMPRALCGADYSVANGETITLALLVSGQVNKNKVTLNSTDTWDTVVRTVSTGGGTIESLLIANTDILLVPSTELSNYDNS